MSTDVIGGFPIVNSNCLGCQQPLLIENAWMTDGCPCNSQLGCNNQNETRWRLLMQLQQQQSHELSRYRIDHITETPLAGHVPGAVDTTSIKNKQYRSRRPAGDTLELMNRVADVLGLQEQPINRIVIDLQLNCAPRVLVNQLVWQDDHDNLAQALVGLKDTLKEGVNNEQ